MAAGGELIPSVPEIISKAVPDPLCFKYGIAVSATANLGNKEGQHTSRVKKTRQ